MEHPPTLCSQLLKIMNSSFFILYVYVVITFEKDLDHILDIKIVNFFIKASLFIFTYLCLSDYYNSLYTLLFI